MNRTLYFLKITLLVAFLCITTVGCFNFKGSDATGQQETKNSQDNQLYTESAPLSTPVPAIDDQLTIPPTLRKTEDGDNPEVTDAVKNITRSATPTIPIFYVSKAGDNTDGRSWHTAWNELSQIRWEEVSPGDTIIIGGGEYHTKLSVKKSGDPESPITITTNGEQVILDGQRPAPPYCGEEDYISEPGDDAIDIDNHSYIVIDGKDWSGIVIRHHLRGIKLREQASNIIVRNVEIAHNGRSTISGTTTMPDAPGVRLGGTDILFERVIIHDNGQDAFQAGFGIKNFTLRNSWLYNSREHPFQKGKSFNYCSHTDGIQVYDGGVQGPMLIEDSIIGPSFTQGIIIGSKATVDSVVIRNTLVVGNQNAGMIISDGGQSSNWTLQNVTIVHEPTEKGWSVKMRGSNHVIRDSIFSGGTWGIWVDQWEDASQNYKWLTPDWADIAIESDPIFVDDDYSGFMGEGFADFDFTIQNPAIPPGIGSSITSVAKLLDRSATSLHHNGFVTNSK